jgi:enamine deaminase RidA (YjgF/YER057c/UK114 family)
VTVVPTKSFATVGGIIEINLLALTNTATRKKQVIEADIPGMAAYGPCIKSGEFLLPSGLMAIGHEGQIVGAALSPGFTGLAHAGYAQAAAVYNYADALCLAAGTAMANTLRAQYFVSDVTQFPGIAMAWVARFGAQPHPVHLHPDAERDAGARCGADCRFLDFYRFVRCVVSSLRTDRRFESRVLRQRGRSWPLGFGITLCRRSRDV